MDKVTEIKNSNIDEEASIWVSRLDRGLLESEQSDLNETSVTVERNEPS